MSVRSQVSSLDFPRQQILISRCDRWQFQQRLQDLEIPVDCQEDGSVWVDVSHPVTILQIRSVLQQLTASRQELVDWLNQCWQTKD
ncbi:MAG: hypothetical protein SFW36_02800 [Leptolyngbyaceae cyanobacterium bins.59]|nr:hypothetical protein [Leptolyngbyaceae cyanobacterium bins.59]